MTLAWVVQALQLASGVLWLAVALYLSPRLYGAWKAGAGKLTVVSARNGFLAWLQVGFIVQWLVWPQVIDARPDSALVAWAALYAMSGILAYWFLTGAIANRGR